MDISSNNLTKPKQLIKKPIFLYLGISGVVVGSLIWYFFIYRNIEAILWLCGLLITLSWLSVLYGFFSENIWNRQRVLTWMPQPIFRILSGFFFGGIVCVNVSYIAKLEKARENNILTNEPTVTTTALITQAEVRQLKNGTRHYAHIRYVANGDTINQERPDDQFQFQAGEYYTVKYSVKFSQMFKLYPK